MVQSTSSFPERFGPYTLLQRVAVGGMAELLLAIKNSTEPGAQFLTIKRIRSEYASDPDYVDFFISEGLVSLRCDHPNLAKSFDLGRVGSVDYLAMEYIRGHTLFDVIQAAHQQQYSITIETTLRIVTEVAKALQHLHAMLDEDGKAMRVVHRDVTPQNIMIDSLGGVRLIDLGIARSDIQVHETDAGVVKGKFSYMAPEQFARKRSVDCRADLFSLGVVLHEMLTARSLFSGTNTADTMKRVRKMAIPKLSSYRLDVPPVVDDFAGRALQRNPDHRYQSATDMLHSLNALLGQGIVGKASVVRDEVLRLCGDPKIPTLSTQSLGVLRTSLQGKHDQADPDLERFLDKGSVNATEARRNSVKLMAKDSDEV